MTTVNKEPGERFVTLGKKGQTMELEVPLTPEHMHALERQISDVSAETFRIEEQKKLAVQPLNEQLKEAKAREKELLGRRQRGVMVVPVPVETRANTFKREKWVVRLDTGEEVPDTRLALDDKELQLLMPGVVLPGDNRPDAPVLNLFAQPPKEEPVPGPWRQSAPPPHQQWSLSEVAGKDGEHLFMIATGPVENPVRAWGPFAFTHEEGFHPPGKPEETLGDDVRPSMAEALGLEDRDDGGERIPADESPEFDKLLGALEDLAAIRVDELDPPTIKMPEGGLHLYEASGHPGWAGYVYEGQLFLRPPNLDRFEPPRSPKDKGPLEWDPDEQRFDGARGANVSSEWLTEHDKLLAEFDFLKKTGKLSEPVKALDASSQPASTTGAESEEIPPGGATTEGLKDPAALAAKLTDNGRNLLKALVTSGPNTSARLGSMTGCGKPGSALKHLSKSGLVEVGTDVSAPDGEERWSITDLGRKVHEQVTT